MRCGRERTGPGLWCAAKRLQDHDQHWERAALTGRAACGRSADSIASWEGVEGCRRAVEQKQDVAMQKEAAVAPGLGLMPRAGGHSAVRQQHCWQRSEAICGKAWIRGEATVLQDGTSNI